MRPYLLHNDIVKFPWTGWSKFYYYKYLVDENERSFSLVDTIEVTYSAYVSSAQLFENNVIIDSGSELSTWEFDSDGNLIQQLHIVGNYWVYRTYKYDFKSYWFK